MVLKVLNEVVSIALDVLVELRNTAPNIVAVSILVWFMHVVFT